MKASVYKALASGRTTALVSFFFFPLLIDTPSNLAHLSALLFFFYFFFTSLHKVLYLIFFFLEGRKVDCLELSREGVA